MPIRMGILPTHGGLGDMADSGQLSRILRYMENYAREFDEIHYFSYLNETKGD